MDHKQSFLILLLFALFLFLRIFSNPSSYLLGADNLKYIIAANHFPYHTLYNNQVYLLHPPFYPYVIHFFDLILQDSYRSQMLISLLSSIALFFLIYKLFMLLTGDFRITYLVLLLYTLSNAFISAATAFLKEIFVVLLIVSALYYYIRFVKFSERSSMLLSALFGAVLAYTSDHVILIFPVFALTYLIFNQNLISIKHFKFPNLAYALVPVLIIALAYGSWLGVKYYQYSTHEYYPNGVEGSALSTKDLGFMQLLTPAHFKDFVAQTLPSGFLGQFKKAAFNLGYMFNLEPLPIPIGLNFSTMSFLLKPKHIAYMIFLYLPLALIALYGFYLMLKDIIKSNILHNNLNLYIIGIFLIFLIPMTQTVVSPRYIYTSYLFLFYIISYGILSLFIRNVQNIKSAYFYVTLLLIILIVPFWFYGHSHFVFSNQVRIAAKNTADYINANLPKDTGIMALPGYTVKLIYLTHNRVLGLYPKPERLMDAINYFNISYIVFGKTYAVDTYQYYPDAVKYIQQNNDKFELIATTKEDYSDFYVEEDPKRTDEVYIYKVKK